MQAELRRSSVLVSATKGAVDSSTAVGPSAGGRDPLLLGHQNSSNGHLSDEQIQSTTASMILSVKSRGVFGTATVNSDGSFIFSPQEDKSGSCCGCCGSGVTSLQVPAEEVVGAFIEGSQVDSFRVWYCPLDTRNPKRPVRQLKVTGAFVTSSPLDAQAIVRSIRSLAVAGAKNRPRHIVVVINPRSGPGKSYQKYQKHVGPILASAGIDIDLHVTTRAGHATEIIRSVDLRHCDALVFAGGDGTVFEGLQGIFKRADWRETCKIPLALLPAGSGNALAANCGLWDLVTAAYAVVKGRQRPLDVFSIMQPPNTRFYGFLSVNFGLVANLDIGTENLRWMGSTRFTLGALQQVLLKRRHTIRVSLMTKSAANAADLLDSLATPKGSRVEEQEATISSQVTPGPPTPFTDLLDPLLDPFVQDNLPNGWKTMGAVTAQLFSVCNLPFLDMSSCLTPEADMESGHLELMYTRPTTRMAGLEFMQKTETGQHVDMEFVRQEKVVAMALEPTGDGTWLVVDGEVIPYERMFAEVHPGLCNVLIA